MILATVFSWTIGITSYWLEKGILPTDRTQCEGLLRVEGSRSPMIARKSSQPSGPQKESFSDTLELGNLTARLQLTASIPFTVSLVKPLYRPASPLVSLFEDALREQAALVDVRLAEIDKRYSPA